MFNVARSRQELLAVQFPTTSPPHGATPHVPPSLPPPPLPPPPPHPAAASDSASPTTWIFIGATVARVVAGVKLRDDALSIILERAPDSGMPSGVLKVATCGRTRG